ncbi:MAG: FAD-binding protein [Ketobacteraceae bacterium]|nr:FAD-binding protein [Ketobacteraceae bacterium]
MSEKTTATTLEELPGTLVQPPLEVDEDGENWKDSFDVLVIGLGAAGVSAAIEAVDSGASVAFIDRFEGGGTTARSGSVMYAGGGTALQKRLGINDDPHNMYQYLKHEVQNAVSPATLKAFCEQSADNLQWAMDNGVRYSGKVFAKKISYPVHGNSLYYSGNELAYAEEARPAPRGHLPDGIKRFTAFGPAFVGPLIRSALKKGVKPVRQTRVTRLLTGKGGRVVGVEASQVPPGTLASVRHRLLSRWAALLQIYFAPAAKGLVKKLEAIEKKHGRTVRYRARNGVILATGGFILNRQMTEKYLPKYKRAMRLGTPGDLGEGHALGVSVGGVADRMSTATAWRFINPPPEWPKAALVNRTGQRYINESLYGATIGTRMMEEHNGEAILVMDKRLFESSIESLNLKNARAVTLLQAKTAIRIAKSADTLEALAERCKINPATLKDTILQYNRAARSEIPDPLGKPPGEMAQILEPPFYAIDMSVGKGDITSVITLGGLRVHEATGEVINARGEPVGGLYAAGRAAIGVASNAYISGLSIADGVFSGRRCGAHAAKKPAEPEIPRTVASAVVEQG